MTHAFISYHSSLLTIHKGEEHGHKIVGIPNVTMISKDSKSEMSNDDIDFFQMRTELAELILHKMIRVILLLLKSLQIKMEQNNKL